MTPAFSVAIGVILWVAAATGGHPALGGVMFGVMTATGALLVLGSRSESIRMMRGGADERWRAIDIRATAVSGLAMATFAIVGFVIHLAKGGTDPGVYGEVAAIGGFAYLGALLYLRWRS
jgi:hypothetical protein